jgi:putative endonuclease
MQRIDKKQKGNEFEQKACEFLQANGLILIQRNYRCPRGEIDLIMQDGSFIVFIEVRSRTCSNFGFAEETVDRQKQKKLLYSAMHFLEYENGSDTVDCRFDVIGFSNNKLEWIKDAFIYE